MILTINIGNSHITLGCIDNDKVLFLERLSSNSAKTDLEYAIDIYHAFRMHDVDRSLVEGCVISCVVPALQPIFTTAVERLFNVTPILANAASQNLLSFVTDHPEEIGPNIIVNSVAAAKEYGVPVIVVDLGTATAISVIDENYCFLGGAIMQTAMDALTGGAAQLSPVSITGAVTAVGRTTEESLNGGAVYGNAGMIDGLLDRMEAELKKTPVIIATGHESGLVVRYCRHTIVHDEALTLKGLAEIYAERSAL